MVYKVGMVSLGCPKNQIDAEAMLKKLCDAGFEITPYEAEADVIIVNTCGFIEEAKREAIDNILDVCRYKAEGNLKAIVVTGCLAERYKQEVLDELPEVDAVVGIGKNGDIVQIINRALSGEKFCTFAEKTQLDINSPRVLSTPFYTAYLKIAEGCDNCCTYCAIPMIRGRFRSRKTGEIVKEAKQLVDLGVKEIVLVAQDTTRYGEDLYNRKMLPQLLDELCKIEGLKWIRMLYTYPDRITDELLDTMAKQQKVVNYLDIPIQHCNRNILKRMNRTGDRQGLIDLLKKIRTKLPDVTIRTTLITGFPGEDLAEFEELCEFVKEAEFDRLGCFAYSEEEGTIAAEFEPKVDKQIRFDRAETVMNDQYTIVTKKNRLKIGTSQEVLVEGYDKYIKMYFGRTKHDAPDIDGKVFFKSDCSLQTGEFAEVKITDILEYDLLGERI